jgi:2',3'-cyclic-nucleotide 2'-phosphodiesterase (5'-nucleotidase family)
LGGLARKATIIDEARKDGSEVVIVDAGNLFFKKDNLPPGVTTEIAKISANTIVESFNIIGCDAFSPGSKDFAGGLEFLKELEAKSDFPFVSSNILDTNNTNIFDSYTIVSKGGISAGFIGASSIFSHADLNVSEPIEAIANSVQALTGNVDMIILLFDATEQDMRRLYEKKLNIDLILRSKSKKRSRDGGSKIPTYTAGDRGKYLYQFDVQMKTSGQKFTDLSAFKNKRDHAHKRLNSMRKGNLMVDLREMYADDVTTIKKIENYERQIDIAERTLSDAINTIKFTKHELGKKIIDRPDVLLIVDSGKHKIAEISTPQLPPHNHKNHSH